MKYIRSMGCFLLTVALLLIKNGSLQGDPAATSSKDKMLMGLTSNHTRVFAKDDFFKERFDPKELQIWYRFLNEIKTFVAVNGKGDQKFDVVLNSILENNDTLINTLKMTYNSLFAPDGSYQETVVKNALQKLQQISDAMAALQKTIAKETYLYKSKKEVRDVLEQVALFTEVTAQKARTDLRKKTQPT